MDFMEAHSVQGRLRLEVRRRGRIIEAWESDNMIVDSARSALAALIGGSGDGKTITKIGFGTNGSGPSPDDTGLTSGYVKPVGDVAYPAPGQVQFGWTLTAGEANGKQIREFGLICSDDTLFSRKTRGVIEKESDISLSGTWTITF